MGVLKQGILGGFSGKVANIIGTSWKGIAVIKAMPLSVANPKTAGQVAQRALFKNCSLFGVAILAVIIKPLWDRFSIRMSGFNSFVRDNIDLFTAELPSPAADLVISKGKMAKTSVVVATISDGAQSFPITWTDDSGTGYKLATDVPFAVCTNETQGKIVSTDGISTSKTRSSETLTITLGYEIAQDDVTSIYLAFRRADGTIVSNTSYTAATVA